MLPGCLLPRLPVPSPPHPEWHHGFNQHFGLYDWRPISFGGSGRPSDGSLLQLREGSKALVAVHDSWPDNCDAMCAFAQQQMGVGGKRDLVAQEPAGAGDSVPVEVRFAAGAAGADGAAGPATGAEVVEQRQPRDLAAAAGVAAAAAGGESCGEDAHRVVDLKEPLLGPASALAGGKGGGGGGGGGGASFTP